MATVFDAPADADAVTSDTGTFDMAIAHLFRGEMHRMTAWRQRLDATNNWAIVLAVGMTTFTFGSDRTPPYIMLLALAGVGMCLVIEARRYQHLHHSVLRLRLLEEHYYGQLLLGTPHAERSWRERLAADLIRPRLKIGLIAAVRLRLRRNYLLLMLFITAAWLTKVFIHPASPATAVEFYARLAVGELLPSWFVAATATAFVAGSVALAVISPAQESVEGWATRPE